MEKFRHDVNGARGPFFFRDFFGEVPIGDSLGPLVLRRGIVRRLEPGGTVGAAGTRAYYEVCTNPKLMELARQRVSNPSRQSS
jgi:hypothetical protein